LSSNKLEPSGRLVRIKRCSQSKDQVISSA
jgi:hypothetical protein